MATDLNLMNYFKIGQLGSTNAANGVNKVDAGNANASKPNSIFGNNAFAQDEIGDSFTSTTKNKGNEKTQETTDKVSSAQKATATSPMGSAKAANVSNYGIDETSKGTKSQAASFGMLAQNTDKIDNDNKQQTNSLMGFGMFSRGNAPQYNLDNTQELQELAEALDCEATEDAIKEKMNGMSAKELASIDGSALDIAEDLGIFTMEDVEKKTNVKEKDLVSMNKDQKKPKGIKFGTMTSGDMV